MKPDHMDTREQGDGDRYAWAGPALFAVVLAALVAFFWWFL